MASQYLAFDIETAKDIPGEDFDWRPHRPLGITCAATLTSDANEPVLWYGKTRDEQPAKQMSQEEVRGVVQYLKKMSADGYRILTWNGLGFDFDVLAEESGEAAACGEIALGHVDMMFHAVCSLGYPIALDRAAQGMGLPGKPPGMSGIKAPRMWAEGKFKEVLEYVAQDARTTMQVAQSAEQRRRLEWITRKGTKSSMALPRGWLSAREAMLLPQPDTSWMTNPMPRQSFTSWLPG